MKTEYVLDLMTAINWWWRSDLGPTPKNTEHVAEVLREAGIAVHKIRGGWLECEPRPAAIYEALTGKMADKVWIKKFNCPPEQPGCMLRLLADKGIQVYNPQGLAFTGKPRIQCKQKGISHGPIQ